MLVSIYMPTKNRQDRLRKAIRSALDQTYKNIEIIVVNDGSTDQSAQLLSEMSSNDDRLSYINMSSSVGAPTARNRAILASRGLFLTGLDDDDLFTPERIETFINEWQAYDETGWTPACLYSQDIYYGDQGSIKRTNKIGSVNAHDMLHRNSIGSQIFAPRKYFIECGLFDEEMPAWQDLDMFFRLLRLKGEARLVDAHTYLYDATVRSDRISCDQMKIRRACERLIRKSKDGYVDSARLLVLQMLRNYRIRLKANDLLHVRWQGLLPSNIYILIKAMLRNLN